MYYIHIDFVIHIINLGFSNSKSRMSNPTCRDVYWPTNRLKKVFIEFHGKVKRVKFFLQSGTMVEK